MKNIIEGGPKNKISKSEVTKKNGDKEINPEDKEKEKLNRLIHISYRDNELFQEIIPQVKKALESVGRKFDIQSFPAGTPKEEIRNIINNNDKTGYYNEKELITDFTVGYEMSGSDIWYNKKSEEGLPVQFKDDTGYLDKLVDKVTAATILGEDFVEDNTDKRKGYDSMRAEGEKDFEKAKDTCQSIFKRIIENPNNYFKKIIILPEQIEGHLPFSELKDKERNMSYTEYRENHIDISAKTKLEWKNKATKMIKEWLEELIDDLDADIRCEENYSYDYMKNRNDISETKEMNQDGNIIIVDRHPGPYIKFGDEKKAKLLFLPMPSLLKSAIDQGLIELTEEEKEKRSELIEKYLLEDLE